MSFTPRNIEDCLSEAVNIINNPQFDGVSVAVSREVEQHLAYLSHAFTRYYVAPQDDIPARAQNMLASIRQKRSFLRASRLPEQSYHDAANLYYALVEGQSTLGYWKYAQEYRSTLQDLRDAGKNKPKVLLLGFSTIYSLENLAALMELQGLDEGEITAFDRNLQPLEEAQEYCGNNLFGVKILYKQGDAMALPFAEESFDLVASHLFFTHIPHSEKQSVLRDVYKVLKNGRIFVDDEILVPGTPDMFSYINYFRSLARGYVHASDNNTLRKIAGFMEKFARHPCFFPYCDLWTVEKDFKSAGFSLEPRLVRDALAWPVFNLRGKK